MKTASIGDARSFSLESIQKNDLLVTDDFAVRLICFEAGQTDEEVARDSDAIYQVLEGEALVRQGEQRVRVGKGKLLAVAAGAAHVLENAGGGLLVVMATTKR